MLDTIHGGKEIGSAYADAGHRVDVVDVYRGTTPSEFQEAAHRHYDLIVAPVHLVPDHPLLLRRHVPVITHHEAVRRLLGNHLPHPMIEITGARGKTTTAHALAGILPGPGVLHTSIGTYTCPEQHLLFRKSITPASEIAAAEAALRMDGWLVAETSLGVTGAGDLAIITSPDTYTFAGGKKNALPEKIASARHAKRLLVADNIACEGENVVHVSDVARCEGRECTVEWQGARQVLTNPLF
ncbi:MAG TPA: coenzyme F430 synthase, partial [Methanoregula sp.]|nr:coenzyme F430 synthase [Methanoregula sp.]